MGKVAMSLQSLKEQAIKLSSRDRLVLVSAIVQSLQAESQSDDTWQFLVPYPQSWRKQLYIKGRKLPASIVWGDMIVNEMTSEESAEDWDLPLEAVQEAIQYCETHRELLDSEAEKEKQYLEEQGVSIEPMSSS
jgi:uncharacterized protein (DUF433 family)